jgi:hypothetical protein
VPGRWASLMLTMTETSVADYCTHAQNKRAKTRAASIGARRVPFAGDLGHSLSKAHDFRDWTCLGLRGRGACVLHVVCGTGYSRTAAWKEHCRESRRGPILVGRTYSERRARSWVALPARSVRRGHHQAKGKGAVSALLPIAFAA